MRRVFAVSALLLLLAGALSGTAAATVAASDSAAGPVRATLATMGRTELTPTQTEARFDYQGVTLAALVTGASNTSLRLAYDHTSGPGPTESRGVVGIGAPPRDGLGCDFGPATQAPGAPVRWEPHMFVAALFDAGNGAAAYERLRGNFSALPPPLERAARAFNFSTIDWPNGAPHTTELFGGLDPTRTYAVYVIKVTEPDWNLAFFGDNALTMYGGVAQALLFDSAPAYSANVSQGLPYAARRMEFVGDSLTAGYCNLCQVPNTYAGESYAKTWSFLTAQAFGAQVHTAAWSGYGVVRNCNGGPYTMPDIWERAVATSSSGSVWDWGTWAPDVLTVDLGANDHLDPTHDGPLEQAWLRKYVDMINRTIRVRYAARTAVSARNAERGPLHVFLVCGPWTAHPAWCPYAERARTIIDESLSSVAPRPLVALHNVNLTLPLPDHCCGHPNVQGDRLLSESLIATVMATVGWDVATPPF